MATPDFWFRRYRGMLWWNRCVVCWPIKRYWTLGRVKVELFGGDYDDAVGLANYFKKEDVEQHSGRIRTSKNLVSPVEKKETVKRSECYSTKIRPPAGYHINKRLTYQGYTKDGYPCQHIVFIKDTG